MLLLSARQDPGYVARRREADSRLEDMDIERKEHTTAARANAAGAERKDTLTKWLAFGGIVGPLLFILTFTIAGFMRPGYSAIRMAVSDLGLGPTAWFVNGAGLLNCLLLTAWVIAFLRHTRGLLPDPWRWISAPLLELPAIGYAVASIFTEAHATLMIHTWVGANLALLFPAGVFFVTGLALRSNPGWRGWSAYSFAASAATVVLMGITVWAFSPGSALRALRLGGLLERLVIYETLAWYVYSGWRIARETGATDHGR